MSRPPARDGRSAEEGRQCDGQQRRHEAGQHGRDALEDAPSRLCQPCSHHCGAGRGAPQDPWLEQRRDIDLDREEQDEHNAGEDLACDRDESVVEDPLASEAHVVHAFGVVPPVASGVGHADEQPCQDGQVQRRERLGV